MTQYGNRWELSGLGRTATRTSMWPASPNYMFSGTPAVGQYAGYYADRQKRFYIRSLRRDGVYFAEFPSVLLWAEGDSEPENGSCP
jgi:hypothetical protein